MSVMSVDVLYAKMSAIVSAGRIVLSTVLYFIFFVYFSLHNYVTLNCTVLSASKRLGAKNVTNSTTFFKSERQEK